MYLIVGLGNPGAKYDGTRHNMGFRVIDALADRHHIAMSVDKHKSLYGKGLIGAQKVILAKPQTYMNSSGEAVRALVDYYKIDPALELIVVYDDISLPPGQLRVRPKGSAGGHNGIKSLLQHLGSDAFARVRVGIGEPPKEWDLIDYVLGRPGDADATLLDSSVRDAADAVELLLTEDVAQVMNRYNQKVKS